MLLLCVVAIRGDVQVTNSGCRALEVDRKILSINGMNNFLLTLDLSSLIPTAMTQSYARANDELGLHCVLNMTARINQSLVSFKQRIGQFEREGQILEEYLRSHAMGRHKRVELGTLAFLLALVSFVLSSSGLAVTEYQLSQLNGRMDIMSKHLDKMKANQKVMNENLEFLFEEKQFIGVQANLLTSFVNDIQGTHSCNLMSTYFEYSLSNLETRLDGIFNSVVTRTLSLDVIDRNILDKVVRNKFFRDTIYLMHPSALYVNSKLDLISLKGNKLSLMVSYPVIERIYRYKRVDIIESPPRLLLEQVKENLFHSFLVPVDVQLQNISQRLEDIRTARDCIYTKSYEACDVNGIFSYNDLMCLSDLLVGNDDQCTLRRSFVFDFEASYSSRAVLVALRNNTQILDTQEKKVLYKKSNLDYRCAYLLPTKGLVVKSIYRQEKLFETNMVFQIKNEHTAFLLPFHQHLVNLTVPERNHTRVFTHVNLEDESTVFDKYFIIGVSVASTVVTLLILLFIIQCVRRNRIVEGSTYFAE